jgi:GNAT superfamily N-acetyltransferase
MVGESDAVGRVTSEQWRGVTAWLERGLRDGIRGRLQAEYPISLTPENAGSQRLVRSDGHPLSHAMVHRVTGRIGDVRLPLGLIGLVYTEEEARGRGLAGRCIEACVEDLLRDGVALAVLWSDRHAFYARLGFHPAGRERFLVLDQRVLGRVAAREENGPLPPVSEPLAAHWPALEALYEARRFRADRRPGDLALLAAAPESELRVACRDGQPVAYAALGRGNDFAEVVHEWAGAEAGVLACLEALLVGRRAVGLMTGPEDGDLVARLREAGAAEHDGVFGLVRLLDPRGLWKKVRTNVPELEGIALERAHGGVHVTGSAGSVEISDPQALALLLEGDSQADLNALTPALSDREWHGLEKRQPLPLYLWGFDSI